MKEGIRRLLPKFFVDKWEEVDVHQVDMLPTEIRQKIVHGTDEEAVAAVNDIRARERIQKVELLGEAALDLLSEMRETIRQFDPRKTLGA